MKKIFEQEDFLDSYICEQLIDYQEKNSPNDMSLDYWRSRLVAHYDDDIKSMTDVIHSCIVKLINNFYDDNVYLEFTSLVYWGKGMELKLHADNLWLKNPNKQHHTPQRDYSSILYLNDKFEGGETYFKNSEKEYKVKPKTGKLIFFPSGADYPHGVKEITKGERYTLATWFTRDKNYAII